MKILKNILIQEADILTKNNHRYKLKTLKKIAKNINDKGCYGNFGTVQQLDICENLQLDQIAFSCINARCIDRKYLYCDIQILDTPLGNLLNKMDINDIYFGLVGTGKLKENFEIYDYEFCRIDAYRRN